VNQEIPDFREGVEISKSWQDIKRNWHSALKEGQERVCQAKMGMFTSHEEKGTAWDRGQQTPSLLRKLSLSYLHKDAKNTQ
jgi:hypothetical protein